MSKKKVFLFSLLVGVVSTLIAYWVASVTKWKFLVLVIGPGIFAKMMTFGVHGSLTPHPIVSWAIFVGTNALYNGVVFFVLAIGTRALLRSKRSVLVHKQVFDPAFIRVNPWQRNLSACHCEESALAL